MSNLFTAVSVEQQEIVSGGVLAVPNIASIETGSYNAANLTIGSWFSVGPNGTVSVNTLNFTGINTTGAKTQTVNFVGFAPN